MARMYLIFDLLHAQIDFLRVSKYRRCAAEHCFRSNWTVLLCHIRLFRWSRRAAVPANPRADYTAKEQLIREHGCVFLRRHSEPYDLSCATGSRRMGWRLQFCSQHQTLWQQCPHIVDCSRSNPSLSLRRWRSGRWLNDRHRAARSWTGSSNDQ